MIIGKAPQQMLKIIISSALLSLSTTICFAQLKIEINEKGHRKIILQGKFDKDNWMIESSYDFKNWKKLRLIKNNSIIDSRDSVEVLLEQHSSKYGGFGIRTWTADGGKIKSFDETKGQYEILSQAEFAERFGLVYPIQQYYRARLVE